VIHPDGQLELHRVFHQDVTIIDMDNAILNCEIHLRRSPLNYIEVSLVR